MNDTIFLLIETFSPALQMDCGACEVHGAFYDHKDASAVLDKLLKRDGEDGYYPVDTLGDVVTVYKNGDEDSELGSEYEIKKISVQ